MRRVGEHVRLDGGRCINCGRCVRFCAEISATCELHVFGMGAAAAVAAAADDTVNPLSGNLVDICPAGALVDQHCRSRIPAWRLRGVDTTCSGCGSGCSIRVDVHQDRIVRLTPRYDPEVNQYWICDRGRYGWPYVHAPQRLATPLLRRDGALTVASWDEAIHVLTDAAQHRFGPDSVGLVCSGCQTNEETYLAVLLATELWRTQQICLLQPAAGGSDQRYGGGFTVSADPRPNGVGTQAVLSKMGVTPLTEERMLTAMASGPVRAAVVLGGSPRVELPPSWSQALAGLELLVVADVLPSALSEMADLVLPALTAFEKHGTMISTAGHIRRLRTAVPPVCGALGELEILQRLARAHGADWETHPRQLAQRLTPLLGPQYGRAWAARRDGAGPDGQPFGGAWADWQRRSGLLGVADHTKRGADATG